MSPKLYLRVARFSWIGAISLFVVCLCSLYLMGGGNPNGIVLLDQFGPGYRAYAVYSVLSILLFLLSLLLRHRVLIARQIRNDLAAQVVLNDILANRAAGGKFFVYLRSFETTGKLRPPFFFSLAVLQRLQTNELESFLALGLEKAGLLLGLGRPGENVGAARIRVADAEWQADIQQLISHAAGILLIPSAHAGTRWEIQHLKEQKLLSKTIFIMPPANRQFDWLLRWKQASASLLDLSITLPEYQPRGLLFTIDSAGQLNDARMFPLFYRRSLTKSVKHLLEGGQGSGMEAVRQANRTSRLLWFYGKWNAILGYFAMVPLLLLAGTYHVLTGTAVKGVNPTPAWSGFYERYNTASAIGSGQSLVDADILLSRHSRLPQSEVDAMARRALLQIDEEHREVFLLGFGELLTYSPNESVCDALADGHADEVDRLRVLVHLPDTQMELWMQARQSAAFAALRGVHSQSSGSQVSGELESAVHSVLSAPAAQDLIGQLNATSALSGTEACRMGIDGAAALSRLNQAERAQLALLLAKRFSN